MTTIGTLTNLNYLVLRFASQRIQATPSQIIDKADEGDLIGHLIDVGLHAGEDVSSLESLPAVDRRVLNEQLASWANVIDVERKYGLDSDGGDLGFIALALGINDQVRSDAGDVPMSWT